MELTRRNFLAGAAVAGAGMAAGLMSAKSALAEEAPAADEAAPAEHNPANTETCDIVVVGSGSAGLCCAVRAKQLGANVILLEKTGMFGGSSNYAEGFGALNSFMHRDAGMEFDLNEAFLRIQDYHHWGSDSKVLHRYLENAGQTIDWLHDECGINFFKATVTAPTSYPSWHLVADADGNVMRELEGFFQPMVAYAESIGLDMRLKSPATGLIVEDGAVKGVYFTDADGVENAIEAENVVLATGGWADNAEMCEEFAHVDLSRLTNWGAPGRDGDGITWARELGAELHFPGNIMYASTGIPEQYEFEDPAGWIFTWNPGLRVNNFGKRFFNEMLMADFSQAGNAIMNEDAVFTIIDQAYLDFCTTVALPVGLDSLGPNYLGGEPFTIGIDAVAEAVEAGRIQKADTIEELAGMLGIDAETLQATIDEYNACAETGDPVFGVPAEGIMPVATPPFYGVRNNPALFCTVGGLRSNEYFQVLKEGGEIIPNLYALGGDNSTYCGAGYDVGILAGSQQGWCATGGRLVAEQLFM